MVSIEHYLHSREVFWGLIGAGVELERALIWRAHYLDENNVVWCAKCRRWRHTSKFYVRDLGTLMEHVVLPCKECKEQCKLENQQRQQLITNTRTCHR